MPVGADQELREIPLNLSARLRMQCLVRQELVERRDVLALDRHLASRGKVT